MIVFISDLHIGATVPLSPEEEAKRNETLRQLKQRGEPLQPLKLQLTYRAVHAFRKELTRLAQGASAKEVTLVLLGDIFDLIQTRAWIDPKTGKPTAFVDGDPSGEQILDVLREAAEHEPINAEFFAALRELDVLTWRDDDGLEHTAPVTRVFVPGNHDRLCNAHESVRSEVRKILGISVPPGGTLEDPFNWDFSDPQRTLVFARHGHEFDAQNYAGSRRYDNGDHLRAPIGDILTTHIGSRLYDRMARALNRTGGATSHPAYPQTVRALEAMFAAPGVLGPVNFLWKRLSVSNPGGAIAWATVMSLLVLGFQFAGRCCRRPWFGRSWCHNVMWGLRGSVGVLALLVAIPALLAGPIGLARHHVLALRPVLADLPRMVPVAVVLVLAVVAVAQLLRLLPRKPIPITVVSVLGAFGAVISWHWHSYADRGGHGWLTGEWILFGVTLFAALLWGGLLFSFNNDAALKRGAERDAKDCAPDVRYIVYGHTHNAVQELVTVREDGTPVYYLNSGTWHQKLDPAADGSDFVSHKNMTYVVIYTDDEARAGEHDAKQLFETWTGTLYDGDCFGPRDLDEPLGLLAARAAATAALGEHDE